MLGPGGGVHVKKCDSRPFDWTLIKIGAAALLGALVFGLPVLGWQPHAEVNVGLVAGAAIFGAFSLGGVAALAIFVIEAPKSPPQVHDLSRGRTRTVSRRVRR
jgi:hypothetical protein